MENAKSYLPVAVVGMGCRFPGDANSPEEFWKLLVSGKDAVEDVPADRWNQSYFHSGDRAKPGSLISPQGGFIKDIAAFDNSFFGFSAMEAANMDPQQRLLLQVSWEAMEQGSIPADRWAKKPVGVFMGCFTMDYHLMQFLDPLEIGPFATTGTMNTMLSNRLSYAFDFTGPSMSVDTACSASLTAVHQACSSLQSGESEMALAGGSMLMLIPDYHIAETKTGMLSKDARCKSFAAGANGYVRSEGVGVVVLKLLEKAITDGDKIQAVIIGSAINQDGRTHGITMPNPQSQMAVMQAACKKAGIQPSDVNYVEAHGTGTSAGDPVEAAAIGTVFGQADGRNEPLWMGSCKSNIGHTEAAAGIAGLIKTVLCVRHRQLPPNLHIEKPNPAIAFDTLNLKIPVAIHEFPKNDQPLVAGVNSFGFGGSNAHVLIQEYPLKEAVLPNSVWPGGNSKVKSKKAKGEPVHHFNETGISQKHTPVPVLFPFSAQSDKALKQLAASYASALEQLNPDAFGDFCFNVATRRSQLSKRKILIAKNQADLGNQLRQFSGEADNSSISTSSAGRKMIWVFSGTGQLRYGMSSYLLEQEPVFRSTFLQCNQAYLLISGFSVVEKLQDEDPEKMMDDPVLSHPAQFFHQVSLAALWRSRGLQPDAVVGYSAGEMAAFYEAGAYTLDECLACIFRHTSLLAASKGKGGMLAVDLAMEAAMPFLEKHNGSLCIGAYNSPGHITISGTKEAIRSIAGELKQENIFGTLLQEEMAYHHKDVLAAENIDRFLQDTPLPKKTAIPLWSATTASIITPESFLKNHWVKNVCSPVLFTDVIQKILATGSCSFLEISGKTMLLPYIHANAGAKKIVLLNPLSLLPDVPEDVQTLARVADAGIPICWGNVFPKGNWMDLPSYPWQNEVLWQEPERSKNRRLRPMENVLLGTPSDGRSNEWETVFSIEKMPWFADHIIKGECLLPGATYVEMAFAALKEKQPGACFTIENLRFLQPVRVHPTTAFFIRFYLDEEASRFRVSATRSLWPLHFETVATGEYRHIPPGALGHASPKEWAERFDSDAIPGSTMYRFFNSIHFQYGPVFRGLQQINKNGNEAFCSITVPAEFLSDGFTFHPVALDIAFHAILATKYEQHANGIRFEMPAGIGGVRLFRPPAARMLVHATITEKTNFTTKTNACLYDEQGRPVGIIEGFETVVSQPQNITANIALQPEQYLAVPEWEAFSHHPNLVPAYPKQFLILFITHPFAGALLLSLKEKGHTVLPANTSFFETADEESIVRELSKLLNGLPATTILINCLPLEADDYNSSIRYVTMPFAYLAKAIRQTGFGGKVWSVSQQAQAIQSFPHNIAVFQAGLWGIANVFCHQEFKENAGGIIDISKTAEAGIVADLLTSDALRETMIAVRGDQMFCRRLNPVASGETNHSPVVFNANSTYIITGAFGAIGKEVVQWAIRSGARKLLFTTSRNILPDTMGPGAKSKVKNQKSKEKPGYGQLKNGITAINTFENEERLWLQSLREQGVDVEVHQVDLGNEASVQHFVVAISGKPIRGIMYCAGISKDQLLEDLDEATLRQVTGTKVLGAYLLHQALLKVPLEHFVLFSSVGSLLPNRGIGSYAAANAALDALAQHRRHLGLPALSINWGPWSSGMFQKAELEKVFSMIGIGSLSPKQGIALLESVFLENRPQIVVQAIDWNKFLSSSLADSPLFTNYRNARQTNLITTGELPGKTNITAGIFTELAALLDMKEEEIDNSISIAGYGMDSMSVMVLSDMIREHSGILISVNALLAEKSIATLMAKVCLAAVPA